MDQQHLTLQQKKKPSHISHSFFLQKGLIKVHHDLLVAIIIFSTIWNINAVSFGLLTH